MLRHAVIATAFLLFGAVAARPLFADVTGPAKIIDGDTIVVAGEHVRLQGIDAPELHQTCSAYGQRWACGRTAAEWLKEYPDGRQVDCVGLRAGVGIWRGEFEPPWESAAAPAIVLP